MSVTIKRVYEPPAPSDGTRVLVDRLWPRGLSKATAKVDRWEKDLAPSDELRRWFGHDPARWPEFRKRYSQELRASAEVVRQLSSETRRGRVTLLYAAHDEKHNNAVVLIEHLKKGKAAPSKRARAKPVAKRRGTGKNPRP